MTDFEDRLRAAMESSVASEQPPRGLVELVRRRHRRHTARMAVAGIAVLLTAAAAIPPTRAALLGRGTTPALSPSPAAPAPASHPAAIPHGQYYGCDSQTLGALGPHWRQGATNAGPIWFINRGVAPDFRFHNPDGTLKAVPIIVMMRDSTTAWVKPAGAEGQYFRFLPGFNDADRYTLRDGRAEATFASCSDQATMYGSGFTEYYIGIIVTGPRCIPIEVRTPDAGQPARAVLRFGRCTTGK